MAAKVGINLESLTDRRSEKNEKEWGLAAMDWL